MYFLLAKHLLRKLWRSTLGKLVPTKKKKRTTRRSIKRKSTLYLTRRKTPILAKRRRLTEFEKGLEDARKLTTSWNSQPHPPKVYINDTRIHHGEVGVMLGVAGILTDDKRLTGLGTGLALDDLHDAPEWFTFKKKDYSQYGFA